MLKVSSAKSKAAASKSTGQASAPAKAPARKIAAKAAPATAKAVAVRAKPAAGKVKPTAAKSAAVLDPVARKPVARPAARKAAPKTKLPAAKPAAKLAAKPAARARPTPAAAELIAKDKVRKEKLVRDSFTMPEQEYAVLGQVKKACLKAGFDIKKSELLRIGVALISQIDLATLQKVLDALPQLKTGRPKKV